MSVLSDAIKHEIHIVDYAKTLGFTPFKIGNQFSIKEHDSVRIRPFNNTFYRHSVEKGGSIIDFVMMFESLDQDSAIKKLRGLLPTFSSYNKSVPNNQIIDMRDKFKASSMTTGIKQEKVLELPEQFDGKFARIYAYLSKSRGINKAIITDLIKRNVLFEDVRHNVCFVGYDKNGEAKFGSVRSTLTQSNFRGDVSGSDKSVGWYIDNKSPLLFVTEAPIDAMSIMTLLKENNRDYKKYNYLALSGTATAPLGYHLTDDIKAVYLATDNDDAGNKARKNIRELLHDKNYQGKIIDKKPISNDWNDELIKHLGTKQPSVNRQQTNTNIITNSIEMR
ncbi:MAG: DUF3991 and TOPRIM domain-containing protein [Oscillospiraceae bacterium]